MTRDDPIEMGFGPTQDDIDESVARAERREAADRDRKGRHAAREYAQWHIGDPDWADAIIDAYLMPDSALETLRIEQETA